MTAPTAQMRCLSPAKASQLAERLREANGVPAALASAEGDMLRAPIDDIGFAFFIVATAVEEGFAEDDDAGDFQQQAIDYARGRRGTRVVGVFCDSCRTRFEAEVPARTRQEGFESIRKVAAEHGWSVETGVDLCPACTTVKLLDEIPVVFWVCPVPEHRGSFFDPAQGHAPAQVDWESGVAYCMAPGCTRNSRDEATAAAVGVPGQTEPAVEKEWGRP